MTLINCSNNYWSLGTNPEVRRFGKEDIFWLEICVNYLTTPMEKIDAYEYLLGNYLDERDG